MCLQAHTVPVGVEMTCNETCAHCVQATARTKIGMNCNQAIFAAYVTSSIGCCVMVQAEDTVLSTDSVQLIQLQPKAPARLHKKGQC